MDFHERCCCSGTPFRESYERARSPFRETERLPERFRSPWGRRVPSTSPPRLVASPRPESPRSSRALEPFHGQNHLEGL